MEREISVMTSCHNRFLEGQHNEQNLNITKTKMESHMLFTSYSRTLGRYRSRSKFNGIFFLFLSTGRSTCIKEDFHGLINLHRNMDGFREERRKIKLVRLFSWHWQILFGKDPEEERAHDDLAVPQKGPSITSWKPTQNAVFWVRLTEAEDLGLEFWQTKSFAIMTYATITWRLHWSCDIRWWRWSTFRTTWNSKATAQGNVEQELGNASSSSIPLLAQTYRAFGNKGRKARDLPEVQDGSKHILEVDQSPGNLEQSVSTMDEIHTDDVDVTTSTIPSEDAKNQIIERIKVDSKENFVFTKIRWRKAWNSGPRVHSSRPRHGQCWAHRIEDFKNSCNVPACGTRRI